MRYSIGELARRCGCSVRTLRYYDEIGLLHPTDITDAGYRFYDDDAEKNLHQILFYRELELPLRQIAQVIGSSETERTAALRAHQALLLLKQKRTKEQLRAIAQALKGEPMKQPSITAEEIRATTARYKEETKERWGQTEAYRQSMEKSKHRTDAQAEQMAGEAEEIFTAFAAMMDNDPAGTDAQALVRRWQAHITAHYYDCTKEMLRGLGELYVSDPRFTSYIDRFGDGTAQFMRDAIRIYCR